MRKFLVFIVILTGLCILGCSLRGTADDVRDDMVSPDISYSRAHIAGSVIDSGGRPVAVTDMHVYLSSESQKSGWDTSFAYTPMQKALTTHEGKYDFYNIVPGRYMVSVVDYSKNPAVTGTAEVNITAGNNYTVNVTVGTANSVVSGTISDSGKRQKNMRVELRFGENSAAYKKVWTNSLGEFCFVASPSVSPITLMVIDSMEVTFSQRSNILLTAGSTASYAIVPAMQTQANRYVLRGTVTDGKTSKAIDNTTLQLSQGTTSFYTISKEDGTYQFDFYNSSTASYELKAQKTGFLDSNYAVEFGDSREIVLNVSMAYNIAGEYFNLVGRSFDNAGQPLGSKTIEMKVYDTDEIKVENLMYTYTTKTDGNGNFVFTDVSKTYISGRDTFFYVWIKEVDNSTVEVTVTGTDMTYIVELRQP